MPAVTVFLAECLWVGGVFGADTPVASEKTRNMEERRVMLGGRIATRFSMADVDRNGYLTKDEFDKGFAGLKGWFEDIDVNRDQYIAEAELLTWRNRKFELRRTGFETRRGGGAALSPGVPAVKP